MTHSDNIAKAQALLARALVILTKAINEEEDTELCLDMGLAFDLQEMLEEALNALRAEMRRSTSKCYPEVEVWYE